MGESLASSRDKTPGIGLRMCMRGEAKGQNERYQGVSRFALPRGACPSTFQEPLVERRCSGSPASVSFGLAMPVAAISQRGVFNALHHASSEGSAERAEALLSCGAIDIDQGDSIGLTPLMHAARGGSTGTARILLSRGANFAIASVEGLYTALHISSQCGNLGITLALMQAGADIEARTSFGGTPLHMAAEYNQVEVMRALAKAGANIDSRTHGGCTPLHQAGLRGHLYAVRELLSMKAHPSLTAVLSSGLPFVPLDVMAEYGHLDAVREMIQEVGVDGCGGASGGVDALQLAAKGQHIDVMAILTGAGVIDTGRVLSFATMIGRKPAVMFLLHQQKKRTRNINEGIRYVNNTGALGTTPLYHMIDIDGDNLHSPPAVRFLIDTGAITTSVFRNMYLRGTETPFDGTLLALVNHRLRYKKVGGKDATAEQLNRLEGVRRVLLQVEAAHAVSWLWCRDVAWINRPSGDIGRSAKATAVTTPTAMRAMLPMLRRRSRRHGLLLAPLWRLVLCGAGKLLMIRNLFLCFSQVFDCSIAPNLSHTATICGAAVAVVPLALLCLC